MIEIIGGLMMMSGGGLMVAASVPLGRVPGPNALALAAALASTPLPPPDEQLDALVASIA